MLDDAGDARHLVRSLGRPEADWLDLSTGINPHGWDAPTPPPACWYRLPSADDGLLDAARHYYGTRSIIATPGSRAALALLPFLRSPSRVAVVDPGYPEHAANWRCAGHQVAPVPSGQLAGGAGVSFDVLVVSNPSSHDGTRFDPAVLLEWRTTLAARGGWMVVDEAFVDLSPDCSLASHSPLPGLIVLRSIDEFFGLPGIRVGFALGPAGLLARLEAALGPWPVNAPGRWIARQALEDAAWQHRMQARLRREGERLHALVGQCFNRRIVGTPLFATVLSPYAAAIHECLALEAMLVRLLDHQDGLRVGLPPDEADWLRLGAALGRCVREYAGA